MGAYIQVGGLVSGGLISGGLISGGYNCVIKTLYVIHSRTF